MTVAAILMQEASAAALAREDDNIVSVAEKLTRMDTGAVIVVSDAGRLAGTISDKEMTKALLFHRAEVDRIVAKDIMSADVATCNPDQTDLQILLAMTEKRIRHMPVVVDDDIVGLVTLDGAVRRRLSKIGSLTQQVAQERDGKKRLRVLDQHASETAAMFAVFRAIAAVQNDAGLESLDVRAMQMLMHIGDADKQGFPVALREFMKFRRWGGGRPTVRKIIGQLEDAELVKIEPVVGGGAMNRHQILLSGPGRDLLSRMAVAVEQARDRCYP